MVDAFTDTPFKGNPAAVYLLEEEELAGTDDQWMQAVAKEFNVSATAFITPAVGGVLDSLNRRFHLRYFIRAAEIELCGHATLASAHFLFESGLVKGEMIEFYTKSGILTIKKVQDLKNLGFSNLCTNGGEKFSYELDFPVIEVVDCTLSEIPSIPITLNGLSVVNASKTNAGDLIVELTSGKDIVDIRPNFDEIERCAGRSVVMTAPAPPGTGFELYTRVFCPKMGHNEDPVTGSVHCALAGYWSKKLGKQKLIAYQASTRGGILQLQLDEQNRRVRIRGDAVTVMAGTLYA